MRTCMCASIHMLKNVYAGRGWAPVCAVQLEVLPHTSGAKLKRLQQQALEDLLCKLLVAEQLWSLLVCMAKQRPFLHVGEFEHV